MRDQIIYCSDLAAFRTRLKDLGYAEEVEGELVYNLPHAITPVLYKENESMALVRDCVLNLDEFDMLESLGDYDSIVLDENSDKLDKYKSIHNYETEYTYEDEDGTTHTYTKPFKIGAFA